MIPNYKYKAYSHCELIARIVNFDYCIAARMAELVDALGSGSSIRKDVQVRLLFRAQKLNYRVNLKELTKIPGQFITSMLRLK